MPETPNPMYEGLRYSSSSSSSSSSRSSSSSSSSSSSASSSSSSSSSRSSEMGFRWTGCVCVTSNSDSHSGQLKISPSSTSSSSTSISAPQSGQRITARSSVEIFAGRNPGESRPPPTIVLYTANEDVKVNLLLKNCCASVQKLKNQKAWDGGKAGANEFVAGISGAAHCGHRWSGDRGRPG